MATGTVQAQLCAGLTWACHIPPHARMCLSPWYPSALKMGCRGLVHKGAALTLIRLTVQELQSAAGPAEQQAPGRWLPIFHAALMRVNLYAGAAERH